MFLAKSHISCTGKIKPVELVIWLKKITLVFLVYPDRNALINCSFVSRGNEIVCLIYLAPVFLHIKFQVLSNAPYSWSDVRISSSLFNLRLLITVFNAVEGLGKTPHHLYGN